MLTKLGGVLVALVLTVVLAPGAGAGAAGPATYVMVMGYRFDPDPLVVPVGTRVTWMNHDRARHDITATSPAVFASPELSLGDEWTITLDRAETITYTCTIHPDMVGTIRVVPAPGSPNVAASSSPPVSIASVGAAPASIPPASAPASLRPLALLIAFVAAATTGAMLALRRRPA